jgi:hypothetical protein
MASLVSFPMGLYYTLGAQWPSVNGTTASGLGPLNGANDRAAYIGRAYIDGRPGSAKTISAAGGGSISFFTGTLTFANGTTSVTVGIQDVDATTGPVARPDGSFDVASAALVGGGGGITGSAWNTITMTGGTGSKSITHGDLIAVVIDMTARGGADTINISGGLNPGTGNLFQLQLMPFANAGTWAVGTTVPNCVITFDDGTLGIIDTAWPYATVGTTEAFADGTNPDERGMLFQLPWDCKIDGLFTRFLTAGTDAGFDLNLYGTPTGTPSVLATKSVDSNQHAATGATAYYTALLASELALSKGTDYCLAVRATGANNVTLTSATLVDTAYRTFLPGSTSLAKATRDGGSGAFTAESPAITLIQLGVRISALVQP